MMPAANMGTTMHSSIRQAIAAMFVKLLRPLVRVAIRHGLSCPELEEILRWVYVDVVTHDEEFRLKRYQTNSRAAFLTGLSRKEVHRLKQEPPPHQSEESDRYTNRAARVIEGWTEDPQYSDGKDQPRLLSLKGEFPSFDDLVLRYGADVPPKTVLDELLRCTLVEIVDGQWLRLLQTSYIPPFGAVDQFEIMAMCGADLLNTMEKNCQPDGSIKLPQTEVYSVALPPEALHQLRERIRPNIQEFARRMHHDIYEHADQTETSRPQHRRAGVGIYYFES
jgi:hypothetical protein